MIAQCLAAAGVKQIVWIDDNFAPRNRDECGEIIQDALKQLRGTSVDRTIKVKHFPEFDLNRTEDEIMDEYEAAVVHLKEHQVRDAAEDIERLVGNPKELTPTEFKMLLTAFADRTVKQWLGSWTSGGITLFKNAGAETLFLIDREYPKERSKQDGLKILSDLIGGNAYYIVFTADCAENEEETKRVDYAKLFGIPAHGFAVIAKRGAKPLPERFAQTLRAAFLHRQTNRLADRLADIMADALDEVIENLAAQSVADVDRVVFQKSIDEGASEIDVLLRIFILQQRYAVRNAFTNEAARRALIDMRQFRTETRALRLERNDKTSLEKFRSWRKIEVYEEGEMLNPLHAPLSCGDTFACTFTAKGTSVTEEHMLLSQPCDLMIRGRPKRNAEVGLLVKLIPSAERPKGDNPSRYHEVVDLLPDGKKWYLDFKTPIVVDLSVLDWCVFNSDGAVRLQGDMQLPRGLLTHGYEKLFPERLAILAGLIANDKCPLPSLTIGPRNAGYAAAFDPVKKELSLPLRRVGRIDGALAQSCLAAWAAFHTRAALDHDFAHADCDSGKASQTPPETKIITDALASAAAST